MRYPLMVIATALSLSLPAYAAPTTFDLYSGLADGGSVVGTIQIDPVTGAPGLGDFTVHYGSGSTDSFDQFPIDGGVYDGSYSFYYNNFGYGDNATFDISLPVDTLVGYGGGPICVAASCQSPSQFATAGEAYVDNATSGDLFVPEPSAMSILLSGLIAAFAVRRWRTA